MRDSATSQGGSIADNSKPLNTLTPAEVEQLGGATMDRIRDYGIEKRMRLRRTTRRGVIGQAGYESASCEEFTKSCLDKKDLDVQPSTEAEQNRV